MNVSAVSMSGISSGQTDIDKQIQALNKRKEVIIEKIVAVVNGDDDVKTKEEKVKALRMEISVIDLQIQQLMQKKIEREKQKNSTADSGAVPLPPSPSDLIQPERPQKENTGFIDIKI